jgi:hypothetical protein
MDCHQNTAVSSQLDSDTARLQLFTTCFFLEEFTSKTRTSFPHLLHFLPLLLCVCTALARRRSIGVGLKTNVVTLGAVQ